MNTFMHKLTLKYSQIQSESTKFSKKNLGACRQTP